MQKVATKGGVEIGGDRSQELPPETRAAVPRPEGQVEKGPSAAGWGMDWNGARLEVRRPVKRQSEWPQGGQTRAMGVEKEISSDPRAPLNVKEAHMADGSPTGSD